MQKNSHVHPFSFKKSDLKAKIDIRMFSREGDHAIYVSAASCAVAQQRDGFQAGKESGKIVSTRYSHKERRDNRDIAVI